MSLGSVARSDGVRPLQIDHYIDIFSSFKVAWVINRGFECVCMLVCVCMYVCVCMCVSICFPLLTCRAISVPRTRRAWQRHDNKGKQIGGREVGCTGSNGNRCIRLG